MRETLRRILWVVPTLVLITILAFWAVAAPRPGGGRVEAPVALPLFVNLEPQSVRELAETSASRIAAGRADADQSRRLLVRLGGAALPYVLPQLDTLSPSGRSRVALALTPVARRMGVGADEGIDNPEAAVVFWTRFWRDRSIEYRPSVVRRVVRRHAQRPTPHRRSEVREFDTFALPELISAMGSIDTPGDVPRARRMAALAAEVTGQPWTIHRGATTEEARSTVDRWQAWWARHHSEYTSFDGMRRVVAMVTETRYGRWVADALGNELGATGADGTVLDTARRHAPVTLWLVLIGILGGYAAGIALGTADAVRAPRGLDGVSSTLATIVCALPAVSLAILAVAAGFGTGSRCGASLVMFLASAALVSRHHRASTRVALEQDDVRAARALGAGPFRIAARSIRAAAGPAVSFSSVDLPGIVTTAFVVERSFQLDGLSAATVRAVEGGNPAWIMGVTMVMALMLALTQIGSDLLLLALDPRSRVAIRRRRGLE